MTEPLDGPADKSTQSGLPSNSPTLSIMSLALAIVALAIFWPVVIAAGSQVQAAQGVVFIVAAVAGIVLGLIAVVLGIAARRRVRRGDAAGGGAALAGVLLGILAVAMPAAILGGMAYLVYSDYQEFQRCVKDAGSAYPSYLCLKECPQFFDAMCRKQVRW